jgi:3D-(3,5/4)-trihydroxycyclohexane-1,2-dione acylhydrolase (decyclizing)
MGTTGTSAANLVAKDADLIIGIGTRYSDFTTASKTAFQNPQVRFININVAEFDAHKHDAIALVADARITLEEIGDALQDFQVDRDYRDQNQGLAAEWDAEVDRIYELRHGPPLSQAQVIGAVNEFSGPRDVVICAAGSLPGDLHKLWRTRDPKGYHVEYGYSCMGYEVAGGLGAKMADPTREVYVMVGDASYLMMAQEIVTAVQEGVKLTILLLDNHGYGSIGALSESLGSGGFGTRSKYRNSDGQLSGENVAVDFAANARSLGAHTIEVTTHEDLIAALHEARDQEKTTVITMETDREQRVGGYGSWWDVPVAEVSDNPEVQQARDDYERVRRERNTNR